MANTTFAAQSIPAIGQAVEWRNGSPSIKQTGTVVNKNAVVNQSPLAKAIVTARLHHPNQPLSIKVGN